MKITEVDFWRPFITSREVINGESVILSVALDGDGDWQGYGDERVTDDNLDCISVEEALQIDPTLASLPDLKPGQGAWRDNRDSEWQVEEDENEDDEEDSEEENK